MPLFKYLLVTLLCIVITISVADTAKVQINWADPNDYKDIRASSSESRQDHRQRLASNIQAHMDKLASDLADDSTLEMTFTNLTLAGRVRTGRTGSGSEQVRVVRDGYPARMSFSYKLLDNNGDAIKQGEENLTSPLSSTSISTTSRNEPFRIEKKMLTRWFKITLLK